MWYPAVTQFSIVSDCQCSYTNWIHSSSGYSWHVLTAVERQVFSLNLFSLGIVTASWLKTSQSCTFFFSRIHRENFILFGSLVRSSGTSEHRSSTVYLLLCNYSYYFKSIVQTWSFRNILLVSTQHSAATKGLTFLPLCQLIWFALVLFLP